MALGRPKSEWRLVDDLDRFRAVRTSTSIAGTLVVSTRLARWVAARTKRPTIYWNFILPVLVRL